MRSNDKNKVCPAKYAGILDSGIRRLLQNPDKILKPYIDKGMTVIDLGCGPGFFSVEIAKIVGDTGKVIAVDLQQEMLDKIKNKIQNTEIEKRIKLHKCNSDKIDVSEKVDFILAFYMFHEVPKPYELLLELSKLLKPEGRILIVEPKFHVSKKDLIKLKELITKAGFEIVIEIKQFFSAGLLLIKGNKETVEFINH